MAWCEKWTEKRSLVENHKLYYQTQTKHYHFEHIEYDLKSMT